MKNLMSEEELMGRQERINMLRNCLRNINKRLVELSERRPAEGEDTERKRTMIQNKSRVNKELNILVNKKWD